MIFNSLLLALSLLAPCAVAQTSQKALVMQDFSGGLNTDKSSLLIEQNESPSLRNVILDKTGAINRREGYNKRNGTLIGGSSSPVNGVFQLERSNGVKNCVAFSSASGYYSTDACASFTQFVSTLTVGNDVNCDAFQDRLYCVNGTYNFYFDGANDTTFAAPAGVKYIRVHRNRCFVLGATAAPSRVYYSALGNCASWTTSTDFFDLAPEDGDVGTAIGYPIFDMLPFYKKFSTWALKGATPESWGLNNISKNTGAKNHRSIDNYNNTQLFDSVGPNGGRPGIYAFNGIVIAEASRKLRNEIENLDTFRATSGLRTIDSKSDWDSGTFDPRVLSSARDSGFMQSSRAVVSETSSADFVVGALTNLSTGTPSGALTLAYTTITILTDDFADGEYTSSPVWTVTAGSFEINASYGLTATAECSPGCSYINTPAVTGSVFARLYISFKHRFQGSAVSANGLTVRFLKTDANNYYELRQTEVNSNPGSILSKVVAGVTTVLQSVEVSNYGSPDNTLRQWEIVRSTTGRIVVTVAGTDIIDQTDTALSNGTTLEVGLLSANSINNIFVSTSGYRSFGTYTSRIYDTGISTPIWGTFSATVSSQAAATTATFQIQSSTACDGGGFETLTSQSLGIKAVAAARPCVRYQGDFTTSYSTLTPRMDDVLFYGAATGTWTSPTLVLASTITAWGLFQTVETETGNSADIAWCIRTATTSAGAATASCASLTPGSAITASTGAYVILVATYTISSATETARTDSLTINWSESSSAGSSAGKVFLGRYHYCGQSYGGARNDVCYVFDSNGAWVKWTNMPAAHLNVVNQQFVMGDSHTSGGGYVFKLYDGDSDDGSGIDAYWSTKDMAITGIENIKAIDRIFTVHGASNTTLGMSLLANGGLTSKTFSINLSTGAMFGIRPSVVQPPINGNTFRLAYYNTAASAPWQILGIILYFRDLGMMQQ